MQIEQALEILDTAHDLAAAADRRQRRMTITGPQADINLGIQTYVNGVSTSPVRSTRPRPQPAPSATSSPTDRGSPAPQPAPSS
jgi:hypothetical protein